MGESAVRCSVGEVKEILECYHSHVEAMRGYGLFVPKHHLMVYLLVRHTESGNRRLGSTWTDESLNKVVQGALRLPHQQHVQSIALSNMARTWKASIKRPFEGQAQPPNHLLPDMTRRL